MQTYKRLFLIVLTATFSSLIGACATHSPAPVAQTRTQRAPAPAPAAVHPRQSAAIPAPPAARPTTTQTQRSPETLFAALAAAGFDYRRGGKSHASGFDCSGLVAHVFREAYGLSLPHNSAAQSAHGRPVERAELEAGDLVFFNTEQRPYSHVGIYLGDNRFIHAPKPGAVVRTENMKVSYWNKRFDGARRIVE